MPPSSLQPPVSSALARVNVADRLSAIAARMPDAVAVAHPGRGDVAGKSSYATCTFRELDADATALARGLADLGVRPEHRLVLLVPPSVAFVKLVFALLRSGATSVLVDPGMGRKHLVNCLSAAEPDGFVAVSRAQAVRTVLRRRFPNARFNVTVGRRWFWGGATMRQLEARGHRSAATLPETSADDPAAIIFTSGSTGPPKGVLYTHRMFDAQVAEIQRQYDLQPGGADLACFALFGLFNSAMGVTTVFPNMDFSRPASANPRKLLAAASDWRVTQAFASPAVWDNLSRHCEQNGERIPTLRKVFSCGAPVQAEVILRTLEHVAAPGAQMHTPYGATEALPVSTIEAREILGETAAATSKGAGVCVGRKFDSIEWRVIAITDEPIKRIDDAKELPAGEIGELIVCGAQVSPAYMIPPAPSPWRGGLGRGDEAGTRVAHPSLTLPLKGRGPEDPDSPNSLAKIPDGATVWHRMGDVGYLDAKGRFWYCGRKSHRVETATSTLFTECVEATFNQHPDIERAALVRLGRVGEQAPVVAVVFRDHCDVSRTAGRGAFQDFDEVARRAMPNERIADWVDFPGFPVDVRHNAKIDREHLRAMIIDCVFLTPDLFPPEIVRAAQHDYRFMAKDVVVLPPRESREQG